MLPTLSRDNCVLRNLLEHWCETTPNRLFARFDDAQQFTWREFTQAVRQTARALQDLGVQQGDHVFLWLPNGYDAVRLWFAINYIGAVYVPANTAYKGALLQHVVANSGAKLAIVHAHLLERLATIDRAAIETIVAIGDPSPALDGARVLPASALASDNEPLPLARPIEPWDTQSIIYTSGTTGPSKGVLSSYAHLAFMGQGVISDPHNQAFIGPDDRFLITSPLFHVGGTSCVYGTLLAGAAIVMVDSFDTASFWKKIDETGATCVVLLGVMASFLVNQPPSPRDRETSLRNATIVPMSTEGVAFGARFGVTTHTLFSMTEIAVPLISEPNPTVAGSCGTVRDGVEVRLVDENDQDVPVGAIGELVLRAALPWTTSHGYNLDDGATARAWRNGWFHSGDAFRRDANGCFFFVDRFKDSIRRRGENISSFEVELEVSRYPGVVEVAAVAVPSEHGEDEILIALALAPGRSFDGPALVEHLRPRMAHFMIPRYIRVLPELPKTPTRKVEKYRIRSDGVTPDTWDREAAGIAVKRDRIG
ncbi:MAG TPA: AMP-binding protein [Ramlibacter sp.]|nr:AMP-binding protein [Ramlibacter sp.]